MPFILQQDFTDDFLVNSFFLHDKRCRLSPKKWNMSHFGALSRLFFKAEVDICLQLMQYPDAPCMDYFPTIGENWLHEQWEMWVNIPYVEYLG